MESLERLRKWWLNRFPVIDAGLGREFREHIDAIEEEFKAQEQAHKFAYSQVYEFANNLKGQLLDFDKMDEQQEAMAEHGWVKLPVDGEAPSKQLADWIERRGLVTGPLDADGELWHSGDMSDSNWGVIESIAFENGRWLVSGHDMSAPWIPADSIRHHHEPTVEDVLREFADAMSETHPMDVPACIAEYAQRIRLAGDE